MLNRKILPTEDGSVTIFIPEWNESYHSKHGAVREALHVFIKNGLNKVNSKDEVSILEIGFGTGLNSFLTLLNSMYENREIHYTGLEKYPVTEEEYKSLNYPSVIEGLLNKNSFTKDELNLFYFEIMKAEWNKFVTINKSFFLKKCQSDFFKFDYPKAKFDLVYFDAFSARVQPELWTIELFEKIYFSIKTGGLLTTYSAKGSVRRNLITLGFEVEKLAGPPGKREMINAIKK